MPLHAIELMPDAAGDESVRRAWQLLRDAGLPSLLDHRGATNAPHVTAISVPVVDAQVRREALRLIGPLLPVECTLTGLVVLGGRRRVLARLVEAPDRLVAAVLELKTCADGHPFAGWLPHVTLANGLDGAQVSRAVDLVPIAPTPLTLVGMRHWDPDAGVAAPLRG